MLLEYNPTWDTFGMGIVVFSVKLAMMKVYQGQNVHIVDIVDTQEINR